MPPRPRGHCRVCGDQLRARWAGDVLVAGRHDAAWSPLGDGDAVSVTADRADAPLPTRTTAETLTSSVCPGSLRPIVEELDVDEAPSSRHPLASVPAQRPVRSRGEEDLRRTA